MVKNKSKVQAKAFDWKPVVLCPEGDDVAQEFEGLVALEELDDYDASIFVREKRKRDKSVDSKADVKKLRTKKRQKEAKIEGTEECTNEKKSTKQEARNKSVDSVDSKAEVKKLLTKKQAKGEKIGGTEVCTNEKKSTKQKERNGKACDPDEIQVTTADKGHDSAIADEVDEGSSNANTGEIKCNDCVNWSSLNLSENVFKAIQALNFTKPTLIQQLAIPVAMNEDVDILGAAPTGSGKTLAFGIPIVEKITIEKEVDSSKQLRALIIVPTRELAAQVMKHITAIAKYSGVSVGVVFGGLSVEKQKRVLTKVKPDILVATPGRLWEIVTESQCTYLDKNAISNVKFVVIDEADKMTEKGHFEELTRVVNLLNKREGEKQLFVFSATLTFVHEPPQRPGSRRKKVTPRQKMRLLIKLLGVREKQVKTIDLTQKGIGTPSENLLTKAKINCLENEKDIFLYYFLQAHPGRTIIFCNSKDCLRRLFNVLKQLQMDVLTLHAAMPQKKRLRSLERFVDNANSIMIASDVASRGLDVENVEHVVHYQIPRTTEIYVHRSGRTARVSNRGLTLLLCSPKEVHHYSSLCANANDGKDFPAFPIDESLFKPIKARVALAQQVDQLEHKIRKNKASQGWFRNAAKMCDIDFEDRADLFPEDEDFTRDVVKLESAQKRLKALLQQTLMPRGLCTAYLTKEGNFELPIVKGKKAIQVLEDSEARKSSRNSSPSNSSKKKLKSKNRNKSNLVN